MRRSPLPLNAVWVSLLMLGCSQNAVFELQIELPEAPPDDGTGEPWFALVQTRRASAWDFSLETEWGSSNDDVAATRLTDARQWDCISVVSAQQEETNAAGDSVPLDLHVRVRFCRTPTCTSLELDRATPERWYRQHHPFYIGRRTYWRTEIDSVHQCPDCDGVGVCIDGQCGCTTSADCPTGLECEAGNCLEDVDRCEIEGCIDGSEGVGYCREGRTGAHYCEAFETVERASACPLE